MSETPISPPAIDLASRFYGGQAPAPHATAPVEQPQNQPSLYELPDAVATPLPAPVLPAQQPGRSRELPILTTKEAGLRRRDVRRLNGALGHAAVSGDHTEFRTYYDALSPVQRRAYDADLAARAAKRQNSFREKMDNLMYGSAAEPIPFDELRPEIQDAIWNHNEPNPAAYSDYRIGERILHPGDRLREAAPAAQRTVAGPSQRPASPVPPARPASRPTGPRHYGQVSSAPTVQPRPEAMPRVRQTTGESVRSVSVPGDKADVTNGRVEQKELPPIDRARLNEIVRESSVYGAFIGKGVELTDYDKAQLKIVIAEVDSLMQPVRDDPEWREFARFMKSLASHKDGIPMAGSVHRGTFVPASIIDGGPNARIRLTTRSDSSGSTVRAVEIPSKVFQWYDLRQTALELQRFTRSDETIKGLMAAPLGLALTKLGRFVGEASRGQPLDASGPVGPSAPRPRSGATPHRQYSAESTSSESEPASGGRSVVSVEVTPPVAPEGSFVAPPREFPLGDRDARILYEIAVAARQEILHSESNDRPALATYNAALESLTTRQQETALGYINAITRIDNDFIAEGADIGVMRSLYNLEMNREGKDSRPRDDEQIKARLRLLTPEALNAYDRYFKARSAAERQALWGKKTVGEVVSEYRP